jgi:hypothetical protein
LTRAAESGPNIGSVPPWHSGPQSPSSFERGGGFPPYHAVDHGLSWLTRGLRLRSFSRGDSFRREDGLREPERKALAQSRDTSGGQWNGSDRGGQGGGNGVESPPSSVFRPVAAGPSGNLRRCAPERTRRRRRPHQSGAIGAKPNEPNDPRVPELLDFCRTRSGRWRASHDAFAAITSPAPPRFAGGDPAGAPRIPTVAWTHRRRD